MRKHPYADLAPRLPEGELIDPRQFVACGERPVELEIGPGRGGFILQRLAADPNVCLIGLEIRLKWAAIVDQRLRELGLSQRGRVFAGDARSALAHFPVDCLGRVFLHFPDPWWKKRHKKRLVLARPLLEQLTRALRPGGEVFVQTDVEERACQYELLFASTPAFIPFGRTPRVAENPFLARSPREERALHDGLPIYRIHYRKL